MSLPWFRFYAEFSGDAVIQSLAFEDQRHFVILLCLKCDGTLDRPMDTKVRERIICRGLGLDPVTASEAKRRMCEVGIIDDNWQPCGWNKRQYISDNSTPRVRKYRKTKETGNVTETFQKRFGNGPDTDTDTEQKKTGAREESAEKRARFVPPTVEQVQAHIREKGYAFSAEAFVAFYASKGWKVGNAPMKCWQSACVTWQGRTSESVKAQEQSPRPKRKTFDEILGGQA